MRWCLYIYCCVLFSCLSLTTPAQNFVPNSSIETDSCSFPTNWSLLVDGRAAPWYNPSTSLGGTPDHVDTCNMYQYGLDTINFNPSPHSGNCYAGFLVFGNQPFVSREYISIPLLQTLNKDSLYCVSFYVRLAEGCGIAIKNMGVYFHTDSIIVNHNFAWGVVPQVEHQGEYLTNKHGWMVVIDSFMAQGNERFLTIGNFYDDAHTNTFNLGGADTIVSYYFIDDVSVYYCDTDTVIPPSKAVIIPNIITPNDDGVNDSFFIQNLPPEAEIMIFNRWGEMIFHSVNSGNIWDAANIPDGIYYYLISLPNKEKKKGFIEVVK